MIPHISFVGSSGSGKTTLIVKLIRHLSKRGYKVGTIKHTHHHIEIDKRGKDSYRHFHAGATSSMIISPNKIGYVSSVVEGDLNQLLKQYFPHCDLVIIEGFKDDDTQKIEVYRRETNKSPLYKSLKNVLAVATDTTFEDIHCLDINDTKGIAKFVLQALGLPLK